MIEPATLEGLAGLLGVAAAELRVQPLPGGLSNRGCLLSRGGDRWAVRLPLFSGTEEARHDGEIRRASGDCHPAGLQQAGGSRDVDGLFDASQAFGAGQLSYAPATVASGDALTLDIDDELRVLEATSAAGLAPEALAHDSGTGALVTRYLAGAAPLTSEQARTGANIDRIAHILRRLHRLPVPAGVGAFRPTVAASLYTRTVPSEAYSGDSAFGQADEIRRWGGEFERLAQSHEAAYSAAALCHNDLVAANILDDGRLWLVDFEFATCADPILDLASLAGLNGFGPAHRQRLLDAYYGQGRGPGQERAPFEPARFDQVIRLVRLMAFFWALAHGGGRPVGDRARFAASMAAVLR